MEGQAISICRKTGMHMPGARLSAAETKATLSDPGKIERMMSSDLTEEIIRELKLEEKLLLKDDPKNMKKARSLITKYADIFTPKSEGQVGKTDLLELELNMKEGTPIRQRVRPLNLTMQESLDEQIKDWLKQGINQPSVSE